MSDNKHKPKKKKIKLKRIVFVVILLLVLIFSFLSIFVFKVKNIYINGNKLYSDYEILEVTGLDSYPSIVMTSSILTELKIEKLPLIKSVKMNKNILGKVVITIDEYQPYFLTKSNILVYEGGKEIAKDKLKSEISVPLLNNSLKETMFKKLVKSFSKIDANIIDKISEIDYKPSNLDKERFLFLMADGNYSYVTLGNIENINYYDDIVPQLEGKKGIINFDSYRENDAGITITIIK